MAGKLWTILDGVPTEILNGFTRDESGVPRKFQKLWVKDSSNQPHLLIENPLSITISADKTEVIEGETVTFNCTGVPDGDYPYSIEVISGIVNVIPSVIISGSTSGLGEGGTRVFTVSSVTGSNLGVTFSSSIGGTFSPQTVLAGGTTTFTAPLVPSDTVAVISATATSDTGDTAVSNTKSFTVFDRFTFNINSNTKEASLSALAIAAGWNEISPISATINSGVYVWSDNTNVAGLTVDVDNAIIVNKGYIIGKGGKGGDGKYVTSKTEAASLRDGGNGGPAIQSLANTVIINNSGAYIAGGGGGGAGGNGTLAVNDGPPVTWGAGGGGGAGGGAGGKGNGNSSGETVNGGAGGAINENGSAGGNKFESTGDLYGAGGGGGGSGGASGGVALSGNSSSSASGGGGGGGRKLGGAGGVAGLSTADGIPTNHQGKNGASNGNAGTNGARMGGSGGGWGNSGGSAAGTSGAGGPAISGGYSSLTNNGTIYGSTINP